MPHKLFSQRNNLFIWLVAGANLFGEKNIVIWSLAIGLF
jgi:hypothetical protein